MRKRTPIITLLIASLCGLALWQLGWLRGAAARELSPSESAYAELSARATPPPHATSTLEADVPILVYHIVRPSYPDDGRAIRAIAVTPRIFDAELAHLKEAGYQVVGFGDLESRFASGAPLPPKPIILSFDDGWRDQFQYAFPILAARHDSATFFVFTNAIGRKGFMSWNNLRALRAAGLTIGDHTRSHPYLTRITSARQLQDEIAGSKRLLEERLGAPITVFAYPFGQYDPAVVGMVKAAGFTSARGDFWAGNIQTQDRLYSLSAMNAPTTTELFNARFP